MNPETDHKMTIDESTSNTIWYAKNIREYADTIYWMLRTLKEQGIIKESTLATINMHLRAIKDNAGNIEIETRKSTTQNKE